MTRTFPEQLKMNGNINRIVEMTTAHIPPQAIAECFRRAGIHLVVHNGDFPLMHNLEELQRKALSRRERKVYTDAWHHRDGMTQGAIAQVSIG